MTGNFGLWAENLPYSPELAPLDSDLLKLLIFVKLRNLQNNCFIISTLNIIMIDIYKLITRKNITEQNYSLNFIC